MARWIRGRVTWASLGGDGHNKGERVHKGRIRLGNGGMHREGRQGNNVG